MLCPAARLRCGLMPNLLTDVAAIHSESDAYPPSNYLPARGGGGRCPPVRG
jgi:hypothetical protein